MSQCWEKCAINRWRWWLTPLENWSLSEIPHNDNELFVFTWTFMECFWMLLQSFMEPALLIATLHTWQWHNKWCSFVTWGEGCLVSWAQLRFERHPSVHKLFLNMMVVFNHSRQCYKLLQPSSIAKICSPHIFRNNLCTLGCLSNLSRGDWALSECPGVIFPPQSSLALAPVWSQLYPLHSLWRQNMISIFKRIKL